VILTHSPFQSTPDSIDWDPKTRSEKEQQNVKHFADMTAYADQLVGRVVAKLDELKLRENTLLIFIGDNGTLGSITSRFNGTDFKGGKGRTTHRGTHVPCIVNWPAALKQGRVNTDLISSTDFLPTICEAAGVVEPASIDGVSFLPQLRGESGTPREWLYTWYSPRQNADMTVRECAFNHNFKLYRTGEFFDLADDPDEKNPLRISSLEVAPAVAPAVAARKLQGNCNLRSISLQTLDLLKFTNDSLNRQTEASPPGRKRRGPNKLPTSGFFPLTSRASEHVLVEKVDGDFLVIAVMSIQVTDGDQPLDLAAVVHYRKMANAVLAENAAGILDRRLGPAEGDFPGHHFPHLDARRCSFHCHDTPQYVAFGKDAGQVFFIIDHQQRTNAVLVHFLSRRQHSFVRMSRIQRMLLLLFQYVGNASHDPGSGLDRDSAAEHDYSNKVEPREQFM